MTSSALHRRLISVERRVHLRQSRSTRGSPAGGAIPMLCVTCPCAVCNLTLENNLLCATAADSILLCATAADSILLCATAADSILLCATAADSILLCATAADSILL
uniref:Uncharacterized protein n=1 Tax=Knipowitschia caucasica TaxID=637954 RepID=A0AAV2L006_KNICA